MSMAFTGSVVAAHCDASVASSSGGSPVPILAIASRTCCPKMYLSIFMHAVCIGVHAALFQTPLRVQLVVPGNPCPVLCIFVASVDNKSLMGGRSRNEDAQKLESLVSDHYVVYMDAEMPTIKEAKVPCGRSVGSRGR